MKQQMDLSQVPIKNSDISLALSSIGKLSKGHRINYSNPILNATKSEASQDEEEEEPIKWINIIFLPFQLWWQLIIMVVVCVKCVLGPLLNIDPFIYCTPDEKLGPATTFLKWFYPNVCTMFYVIDTFLYIVHRQVTEEATKREYAAKSAFHLLVDIFSLFPLYDMFTEDRCGSPSLWPDILNFHEMVLIYRLVDFFALKSNHSQCMWTLGYLIIYCIVVNAFTCLLLMWTRQGLCDACTQGIYDWRSSKIKELNAAENKELALYVYGSNFVQSTILNLFRDNMKPVTYLELILTDIVLVLGMVCFIFFLRPKLFGEWLLRLQDYFTFHPRVKKNIEEAKARNPDSEEYKSIERFYFVTWTKYYGISSMPRIIKDLPEYMQLDIKQDLVWPVFYHSPIFRRTSTSYKRWLGQYIQINYKQPGERFFTGHHCFTNMYYLKTGVVQFISADDTTVPMISFTGGTLFGDVSFLFPPLHRRIIAHCATYCEVFSISRADILRSLLKFPTDRHSIMKVTKEKLTHSYDLYKCKGNVKGLDRSNDEGIAWVKRRWWEIFKAVQVWRYTRATGRSKKKCEIPPEEVEYHCAKYIGQLVLFRDNNLKQNAMFIKVKFPWILAPNSILSKVWHYIVKVTVFVVLIMYTPSLVRDNDEEKLWLTYFNCYIDIIYLADVIISLVTAIETSEKMETNLVALFTQRLKSKSFNLDLLSTNLIDCVVFMIDDLHIRTIFRFNRLFKTYLLFFDKNQTWQEHVEPLSNVYYTIFMAQFCYIYISTFLLYVIVRAAPNNFTEKFYFGELCLDEALCKKTNFTISPNLGVVGILVGRLSQIKFEHFYPQTLTDSIANGFLNFIAIALHLYLELKHVAALYLKQKEIIKYQTFVSNVKSLYKNMKIHPDLMNRICRYLDCHWKYYHGIGIIRPNLLDYEPYEVRWRVHGMKAENLISESKAFLGADEALIKELAQNAIYIILPNNTNLIMFGVQIENVAWVSRGTMKCEYHDGLGETRTEYIPSGEMLCMTAVFLNKIPLRTYSTASDVEVLYINIKKFYKIIQRYPLEWSYIQACVDEIHPIFDELFVTYFKKHKDNQKKLQDRIFDSTQSMALLETSRVNPNEVPVPTFLKNYREDPESRFTQIWIALRMISVIIHLVAVTFVGIVRVQDRHYYRNTIKICVLFTIIDMVFKMFLPYYNEQGLVVTSYRKCILRYITTTFLVDIVSLLAIYPGLLKYILAIPDYGTALNLMTFSQSLLIYIVLGFFDYWADKPSVTVIYIKILKWQIVTFIVTCYLVFVLVLDCLHIQYSDSGEVLYSFKECWMPKFKNMSWPILFTNSWNAAQGCLMDNHLGLYEYAYKPVKMAVITSLVSVFFWYQSSKCQSLLVLSYRGETLFRHGITQLRTFLKGERVENEVIDRSINHFMYRWKRTEGVNMKVLMNEQIGVIFRQDYNYFFFHRVLKAVNTMLGGQHTLERQLSRYLSEMYFLPREDIVRRMDLISHIYIVYRGKVIVTTEEGRHVTLSKGSIFGQLEGTTPRPSRITARADSYADVLAVTLQQFQDSIDDDVRDNIRNSVQAQNDYMALKKAYVDNPYNTLDYILRAEKVIKIPKLMWQPVIAEENRWYQMWLLLVWVIGPVFSIAMTFFFISDLKGPVTYFIVFFDLLHLVHFVTDLFTMQIYLEGENAKYMYSKWRKITKWSFYVDLLSLIVPWLQVITDTSQYIHAVRLLRIYTVFVYHRQFCEVRSKAMAITIKVVLVVLLMQGLTCWWVSIGCQSPATTPFPVVLPELPKDIVKMTDYSQWCHPMKGRVQSGVGYGCIRMTNKFQMDSNSDITVVSFLKPTSREADYLVSLTFMTILFTNTNLDYVLPLHPWPLAFKVFAAYVLYLVRLWLSSVVISVTYTKYRQMYRFDHYVNRLIRYLQRNGVSSFLQDTVRAYTKMLWKRQKGNWLPDITHQAPLCLREDILGSLYMHHLLAPSLFAHLPMYFLRQLVVRLKRTVIFPGKTIVKIGDICPRIYFIHEGEVEKWMTDAKGDTHMMTLLTINGYFGLGPGLFPDLAYPFTFVSRTVADLVYLVNEDWQDLLDAYPDVKRELYTYAKSLTKRQKPY